MNWAEGRTGGTQAEGTRVGGLCLLSDVRGEAVRQTLPTEDLAPSCPASARLVMPWDLRGADGKRKLSAQLCGAPLLRGL